MAGRDRSRFGSRARLRPFTPDWTGGSACRFQESRLRVEAVSRQARSPSHEPARWSHGPRRSLERPNGSRSTARCGDGRPRIGPPGVRETRFLKPNDEGSESKPVSGAMRAEGELVDRARARDTHAFRLLVERHRDRAYTLALRMLRSPVDAEGVTQDAFVRAWAALPRFRGESSFGTWLHRIVVRRALDRAAVLERRRARETNVDAAQYLPEHMPDAAGASRAIRLERLIAQLEGPQRAAVTLFYYEGRSVEQVASLLGMPAG